MAPSFRHDARCRRSGSAPDKHWGFHEVTTYRPSKRFFQIVKIAHFLRAPHARPPMPRSYARDDRRGSRSGMHDEFSRKVSRFARQICHCAGRRWGHRSCAIFDAMAGNCRRHARHALPASPRHIGLSCFLRPGSSAMTITNIALPFSFHDTPRPDNVRHTG